MTDENKTPNSTPIIETGDEMDDHPNIDPGGHFTRMHCMPVPVDGSPAPKPFTDSLTRHRTRAYLKTISPTETITPTDLRAYMKSCNINQKQLAKKLGVGPRIISKWLKTGDTDCKGSAAVLFRLLEALGI